jgi:hypothetical protein
MRWKNQFSSLNEKTMEWDIKTFEHEVREHPYFKKLGFTFEGRDALKVGTDLELHELKLQNRSTDRTIEITFAPPRTDGRTAVSLVNIVRTSTDEAFNIEHYIKQYHGFDVGDKASCYSKYNGTFQERVRTYLDYITNLMSEFLELTLRGMEWPKVEFDWTGIK